jgi:hypothetical protein
MEKTSDSGHTAASSQRRVPDDGRVELGRVEVDHAECRRGPELAQHRQEHLQHTLLIEYTLGTVPRGQFYANT